MPAAVRGSYLTACLSSSDVVLLPVRFANCASCSAVKQARAAVLLQLTAVFCARSISPMQLLLL